MSFMTERPLTPREFLDECIVFKRERLTGGRFLAALVQRSVTPAQLRLWAKDMYHFVQPESARLIARNLAGELGYLREPDHRDLYLKLLDEGFGISEAEAKEHLPLAGTIGATTALCAFCRSSFAEGLGAFGLALEMQVPGRPNGAAVLYEAL